MENKDDLSTQPAIDNAHDDDDDDDDDGQQLSEGRHKRSISASLLSKISFLRMSQPSHHPSTTDEGTPSRGGQDADDSGDYFEQHGSDADDGGNIEGSRRGAGSRAMATAIQHQRKMRRRRGSLRKTALLGTRSELKEKRNHTSAARDRHNTENPRESPSPLLSLNDAHASVMLTDSELTPRGSTDCNNVGTISGASSTTYWNRPFPPETTTTTTTGVSQAESNKSPTSTSLNGDTTDEDDAVSLLLPYNSSSNNDNKTTKPSPNDFTGVERPTGISISTTHSRPLSISSNGSIIATPSSGSAESYYMTSHLHHLRHHHHHHHHHRHETGSSKEPSQAALRLPARSQPTHRTRSPLIAPELSNGIDNLAAKAGGVNVWDYSETEWWGWIILLVTWLVFVVGMGSSFGVWSWAWDVGETPYAPPELEDDPTLPIVGYYPALMVLTAVMAWVWVVVAWVGMKYFKHANISADDG